MDGYFCDISPWEGLSRFVGFQVVGVVAFKLNSRSHR